MDAQPDISTGTLLGLDNGSTLEVTNSYPIPLFAHRATPRVFLMHDTSPFFEPLFPKHKQG